MIAVVIPCYKVKKHILQVIKGIGDEVDRIYVVDDKCPENSGSFVEEKCNDKRVKVLYHDKNKGVGAATKTGYKYAIIEKMDIVVKVDGDGQMDTSNISKLIEPIINKTANYTKGNRFYHLEKLKAMPFIRIFGNSVLSLINKIISGYWNISDPTNGFTAIDKYALRLLPFDKIEDRYFFESDMLFRLGTYIAVVEDVPMDAIYANEKSNLNIFNTLLVFPCKYIIRFPKRLFYNYFIRDFNIATIHLIFGTLFLVFGIIWGGLAWNESIKTKLIASTGTVMISVLPIILGFQMLLSFISYDIISQPSKIIKK